MINSKITEQVIKKVLKAKLRGLTSPEISNLADISFSTVDKIISARETYEYLKDKEFYRIFKIKFDNFCIKSTKITKLDILNILMQKLNQTPIVDIAKQYVISESSICKIISAEINFKYLEEKEFYDKFNKINQKITNQPKDTYVPTKNVLEIYKHCIKFPGSKFSEIKKKFEIKETLLSNILLAQKSYRRFKTSPEFSDYLHSEINFTKEKLKKISSLNDNKICNASKRKLISLEEQLEGIKEAQANEKSFKKDFNEAKIALENEHERLLKINVCNNLQELEELVGYVEEVEEVKEVKEVKVQVIKNENFNITMLIGAVNVKRFISWRINDMLNIIYDFNIEKYVMVQEGVDSPINKPTAEVLVQSALEILEYINFTKDHIDYSFVKNINNNHWEKMENNNDQ